MKLLIKVPVADLRLEPKVILPQDFSNNPLRLSQLLYGERLHLIEEKGDWLFVEAIDQERFTKEKSWHAYPGWVHLSEVDFVDTFPQYCCTSKEANLSFGVRYSQEKENCYPFSSSLQRQKLLEDAHLFLGTPYLWGGTAFFCKDPIASVDCSGLTYLLCRSQGVMIPRDAHDQFLRCQKINKEELTPGDFLFLSPYDKPERITHVMIYRDKNTFLEAPKTGEKVRILPLPLKFWEENEVYLFPEREKPSFVFYGRINC